jgi:hypothetical protein
MSLFLQGDGPEFLEFRTPQDPRGREEKWFFRTQKILFNMSTHDNSHGGVGVSKRTTIRFAVHAFFLLSSFILPSEVCPGSVCPAVCPGRWDKPPGYRNRQFFQFVLARVFYFF